MRGACLANYAHGIIADILSARATPIDEIW